MPIPPASNADTTGVVGNPGPLPTGTQYSSGKTKDTTDMGAGGGGARPEPPKLTGTPDTEGTYGTNQPSAFVPVSTLLGGTKDTTLGYAANTTNRTYRAPLAPTVASIKDTTNALGYTGAIPADSNSPLSGTPETGSIGAPTGRIVTQTDNLTLSTVTPAAATKTGVQSTAAQVVVVNKGQILTVTDESHVLSGLSAFTLTNNGVTDTTAAIVVKKGATTLTVGVDYTIAATGSAGTRNMSITPIDSVIVNSGDTLLVTYHYGNAKYFANATLVLTTDYTLAYTGGMSTRTFTITRVNTAASTNGDIAAVTYQIGDASYWGSHDPVQIPPAPTIGTAVAGDRKVKVAWTAPTLTVSDDVDGYLVQSDTGGTRYAPGGTISIFFENVVPGQSYKFRVAAFNEAGLGPFSALSNAVTPLNYDEVPTGSLDPKNTVNPIYNADGTIVAGSNLGP